MYTWDELTDTDVDLKGTDSETKVATVILSTRGNFSKFSLNFIALQKGFILIVSLETIFGWDGGTCPDFYIPVSYFMPRLKEIHVTCHVHVKVISLLFTSVYMCQYILRPCKAKSN